CLIRCGYCYLYYYTLPLCSDYNRRSDSFPTRRSSDLGSLVDSAAVRIIGDDSTFGIISDIDDTVMVTSLPRPFLAAWNTFVLSEHARSPVAGMAVLYDRITFMRPATPM